MAVRAANVSSREHPCASPLQSRPLCSSTALSSSVPIVPSLQHSQVSCLATRVPSWPPNHGRCGDNTGSDAATLLLALTAASGGSSPQKVQLRASPGNSPSASFCPARNTFWSSPRLHICFSSAPAQLCKKSKSNSRAALWFGAGHSFGKHRECQPNSAHQSDPKAAVISSEHWRGERQSETMKLEQR